MEIEVNKDNKGNYVCEIMSGPCKGTLLNISELMTWIGEAIGERRLIEDLGRIGMNYAIYSIEGKYMEVDESEILNDLLTISSLLNAFEKSIGNAKR